MSSATVMSYTNVEANLFTSLYQSGISEKQKYWICNFVLINKNICAWVLCIYGFNIHVVGINHNKTFLSGPIHEINYKKKVCVCR